MPNDIYKKEKICLFYRLKISKVNEKTYGSFLEAYQEGGNPVKESSLFLQVCKFVKILVF